MMAYTTLVTPFKIAFVENDSLFWFLTDFFVDFVFGVDIILNFFTAYYDDDYNLITDQSIIIKHYLKGWFFIDFFSILPFSLIMRSARGYSSLTRLARLPRLYKLVKITKLFLKYYIKVGAIVKNEFYS